MSLSNDQLDLLDGTGEVHIRTRSDRGTSETIIWIVVIDGTVYVRSVRGDAGHWYQRALEDPRVDIVVDDEEISFLAQPVDRTAEIAAVSNALRSKYPPGGSLDAMVSEDVLDTTLRLEPRS